MQVTINGTVRDIPESLTLGDLVAYLGLTDGPVAIEVNREVVPRAKHGEHRIAAGDAIEVVHFVGGG
jgi:thiamine biosynthesis protein ThiS